MCKFANLQQASQPSVWKECYLLGSYRNRAGILNFCFLTWGGCVYEDLQKPQLSMGGKVHISKDDTSFLGLQWITLGNRRSKTSQMLYHICILSLNVQCTKVYKYSGQIEPLSSSGLSIPITSHKTLPNNNYIEPNILQLNPAKFLFLNNLLCFKELDTECVYIWTTWEKGGGALLPNSYSGVTAHVHSRS